MVKNALLRIAGSLVFAQFMLAQTTATISGTVRDSTGAVVSGAQIVVLNEGTDASRTIEVDAEGRYSATALSVGTYRVTANREGFQTEVRTGIVLTIGREAVVDFSLAVGAVSQTLEVVGEAPLVETTTASLGSLVDDRTIRALPLNGRSYDQLALLQPDVTLTSPGPTTGSAFNFGTGKRFSVGGQRDVSNSFLLDGTNVNDQANGTPGGAAGTNLGVDTILEFKIFTNSFKAEYGHSSGSVVTAITRSGTNSFHGTIFEYIRNSALDARNFFDVGSSPPPFKRNQFGGVLGGPIKKDKTFFFVGYEGLRQGLAATQIATVPTALARQGILPTGTVKVNPTVLPFLGLYPLPNGRDFGDGTAQFLSSPLAVTNEDNVMVRVDHQLNAKNSIFARYTFDNDNLNAPQSVPSFVQDSASRRQYSTLQANSVLAPNMVNSFRFAYNRTHSAYSSLTIPADLGSQLSFVPGQPFGSITIGGGNGGGGTTRATTALGSNNGSGPSIWAYNIFETGDDFTYVIGKHSLKAGVDIQRMRDNTSLGFFLQGAYNFTTFSNFLAGTASTFQAASPLGITPNWGFRQSLFAVYVQDDYRVNSRLTVNFGLRWESTTDPAEINGKAAILPSPSATATVVSDSFFAIGKKNFEPRVGLAWQLNASGKTVLRAGAGIYHNQIFPWAYFTSTRVPPFYGTFSASNAPFPNGYQVLKGGGLISLLVMAPFLKTPVDDQYNLSIQQQISKSTVVQVAYAGNKANHLLTLHEADTPIPTIRSDESAFYPVGAPRRNTAWSGIRVTAADGNSDYNSLTVTLRRQFSSGFQGQIFYTFAKAMDEESNTSANDSVRAPAAYLDPEDRALDWGLAEFDQRHAIGANFSYPVPFRVGSRALGAVVSGWTLDGIATFSSGLPFTALLSTSVSRNLAGTLAERPNLNPGASQNPTQGTTGAGCPGIPAGEQLGTPNLFYNPCSFSLPLAGTYGNLGRDTIIGPGVGDIDLALEKSFKVRESAAITFRAEMFNVLNHANFGLPNTSALAATGAANGSAGVITYTTTTSRQIQFALRIKF